LLDLTTGEQSGHFSRKRDAREYADKVIAERKVSQAEQARPKRSAAAGFVQDRTSRHASRTGNVTRIISTAMTMMTLARARISRSEAMIVFRADNDRDVSSVVIFPLTPEWQRGDIRTN